MGTKNNPGHYDCYAKLAEDEPYFVLRGKDPFGWLLVNLWCSIRTMMMRANASPKEKENYQTKLREAKACAASMKSFAERHPANIEERSVENAVRSYIGLDTTVMKILRELVYAASSSRTSGEAFERYEKALARARRVVDDDASCKGSITETT